MFLPNEAVAAACRSRLLDVQINWPLTCTALAGRLIDTPLVEAAAAATIAVETMRLFRPVHEFGGTEYLNRMYDEGQRAARLGNTPGPDGDGARYCGRGTVQITGRANYRKYGRIIGVDLEGVPGLALNPKNAAEILAAYFQQVNMKAAAEARDWHRCRELVNGGTNGLDEFMGFVNALLLALAVPS